MLRRMRRRGYKRRMQALWRWLLTATFCLLIGAYPSSVWGRLEASRVRGFPQMTAMHIHAISLRSGAIFFDRSFLWLSGEPLDDVRYLCSYRRDPTPLVKRWFEWRTWPSPPGSPFPRSFRLGVPLWVPILILGPITYLKWRRYLRDRSCTIRACASCRYSLEQLPPGSPCPECGASNPSTSAGRAPIP